MNKVFFFFLYFFSFNVLLVVELKMYAYRQSVSKIVVSDLDFNANNANNVLQKKISQSEKKITGLKKIYINGLYIFFF